MSKKCNNYCDKGLCSNCGSCCTEFIPITRNEYKLINQYIKEKDIQPFSNIFFNYNGKSSINLQCPFRDHDKHKCLIYKVRPSICRLFKCNQDIKTIEVHKINAHSRATYNKNKTKNKPGDISNLYSTRELFYKDPCDTIRNLIGTLIIEHKKIDTEYIKYLLISMGRQDIAKEEYINKSLEDFVNFYKKVEKE